MHAETLALLIKHSMFSEYEELSSCHGNTIILRSFKIEKSPQNITFNNKITIFQTYIC
jgi:hypothetical protein